MESRGREGCGGGESGDEASCLRPWDAAFGVDMGVCAAEAGADGPADGVPTGMLRLG